jgi:hypothetical protein
MFNIPRFSMNKKIILSFLVIVSAMAMVACEADSGSGKVSGPVVYVGGYDRSASDITTPCYWTDTAGRSPRKTSLNYPVTSIKGGPVRSLFVSAGNVYTGGWHWSSASNYFPCYWTGQDVTTLFYGTNHLASVNSIFVSNGTVYAAGNDTFTTPDPDTTLPCYWDGTSDTSQKWPDTSVGSNHYATSIFVAGGTVYIGGRYNNASGVTNACYWTGTTMIPLANDTTVTNGYDVSSIFIDSGTVYASGYYKNGTTYVPCYWTDTATTDPVLVPLTVPDGCTQGFANSLCVSGGTVYVSGYFKNPSTNVQNACYWTGGTRTDLTAPVANDRDYYANAITVYDGTVYVAGSYFEADWHSSACYWKGTARTDLPGNGTYVAANSIVVE